MALESNLGIGDLTIGIDANGMVQYKEDLRAELLQQSKEKINNVQEVLDAINAGWQGVSRDNFVKQFASVREKICEDLDNEYADLENRLTDLQSAYFSIDKNINDQI